MSRERTLSVVQSTAVGDSVTLTQADEGGALPGSHAVPYLVVLLECQRPAARPSLHFLDGTRTVRIGRASSGADREFRREGEPGGESLDIAVPDKWMSSRHAMLSRRFGRWFLSDAESKNGTQLGGESITETRLGDGDVFVAGRTLFLFRNAALVPPNHGRDRVIEQGQEQFATLSPAYDGALEQLLSVATAQLSVLLIGETGSGKEVVARALHRQSERVGPFVALNCGAIPESLVESELFGYVKGAFSGADADREGTIRAAHGGTLFLDEIAEMPLSSQAALLRVLQEREVVPVGATKAVPVDVRVIAATHQDLRQMCATGEFRRDLFARLAGFEFTLPPLRARREDLGLLFSSLLARRVDIDAHPGLSVEAATMLVEHDWPLNIRELDNTVAAAVAFAGDKLLDVPHLPPALRDGPGPGGRKSAPSPTALSDEDRALRDQLVEHLTGNGGNVSATARELGKDRKQIQRWLKRFSIDASAYRRA